MSLRGIIPRKYNTVLEDHSSGSRQSWKSSCGTIIDESPSSEERKTLLFLSTLSHSFFRPFSSCHILESCYILHIVSPLLPLIRFQIKYMGKFISEEAPDEIYDSIILNIKLNQHTWEEHCVEVNKKRAFAYLTIYRMLQIFYYTHPLSSLEPDLTCLCSYLNFTYTQHSSSNHK